MIEIPLQGNAAHQKFSMQLGERFFDFELNYITRFGGWALDIYEEEALLIAGAKLEPNVDLTALFDLGMGRLLFVGSEPTFENLGINNSLVWVDV